MSEPSKTAIEIVRALGSWQQSNEAAVQYAQRILDAAVAAEQEGCAAEITKLKELLIERDGILSDQFKDLKELNDRVLLIELGQQHDKTTPH